MEIAALAAEVALATLKAVIAASLFAAIRALSSFFCDAVSVSSPSVSRVWSCSMMLARLSYSASAMSPATSSAAWATATAASVYCRSSSLRSSIPFAY